MLRDSIAQNSSLYPLLFFPGRQDLLGVWKAICWTRVGTEETHDFFHMIHLRVSLAPSYFWWYSELKWFNPTVRLIIHGSLSFPNTYYLKTSLPSIISHDSFFTLQILYIPTSKILSAIFSVWYCLLLEQINSFLSINNMPHILLNCILFLHPLN